MDIDPWEAARYYMSKDSPRVARFNAATLQSRWFDGRAAVTLDRSEIVAYTSVIEIEPMTSPVRRLFEASTGWSAPGYRRAGAQVQMRRRLYEPLGDALLVSFCIGRGASDVLQRLGWSVVSWHHPSQVSKLIGEVVGSTLHHRLGDDLDLGSRTPFVGTHEHLTDADLDNHLFVWVSDLQALVDLPGKSVA